MKKFIRNSFRKTSGILGPLGFERISLLTGVHKFLHSHLIPDFIEIEGHKLFLDKFDSLNLFMRGSFEEFETEIVKKIIKKGDIVLDVGANIGYYTLIFAKLVGKNGKVFSFEPDPTNFDLLTKNVKINGYENVILVRKALSYKTGKTNLFLSNTNAGDHMIVDTKENRDTVEIEMTTGDDYFRDFSEQLNFIKMDVQGAEIDALRGMSSLLQKINDIKIMIEFAPKWLKNFGYDPLKLLNYLREYDFKLFEIDNDRKKIISVNSKILIKNIRQKGKNEVNLLCSKDGQFLKSQNDLSKFE